MYQNLKIAITDEVQLKAVCEVLESMGFECERESENPNMIITSNKGDRYIAICVVYPRGTTTLTNLLALRDKQFMEKIHA